MGNYKGNTEKLERDAESIVARLRAGETLSALQREYHVGYIPIKRLIDKHIPADEWADICRRNYGRGGVKTQFRKGHVPWTKGRKGLRLSPATEFKPGCMRGAAARKYVAIGTITTRYDKPPKRFRTGLGRPRKTQAPRKQRRYIKIADDGPTARRFMAYARYVYEQARGPVPEGHRVVHLDGDTMNDELSNLKAVPRHLLPKLARLLNPGMEELRIRRRRLIKSRRTHIDKAARAELRESKRGIKVIECINCSYRPGDGKAPDRCPKCGRYSFHEIEVRRSA